MTRIVMPDQTIFLKNQFPRRDSNPKKKEKTSHSKMDSTFGVVYANDLAKEEMEKEKPNFPSVQSLSERKMRPKRAKRPKQ